MIKEASVFIVFPNHLFEDIERLKQYDKVYLIEEFLFFKQYKFHQQKIMFHRASMKYYESYLLKNNIDVKYIEAISEYGDLTDLINSFNDLNIKTIGVYDVCDDWLSKKLVKSCNSNQIKLQIHDSLLYLLNETEVRDYFKDKAKFFQTDFYIHQRKKYNILVDENKKPNGGKWSYDSDNRLKYPKGKNTPKIVFPQLNSYHQEAKLYVEKYFSSHYGQLNDEFIYPVTHIESIEWFKQFLNTRFDEFGPYEDAILKDEVVLNHSVLTPMLNVGLITPIQVLDSCILFAQENGTSLNSLEGFVRQILGWREFIRGVYLIKGREERTKNFWQFNRKIPLSFYKGETGVIPLDTVIKKVLKYGYCHHIERLMILGNYMLLNEYNPDEVYQWFMEMFIDSYDWVMVPNVYGMSQFADGGLMATKPYISGSSYVLKMSNFEKGNWCEVWDALFWHFMNKQRSFFLSNPRIGMLISTYDKMSEEKKATIELIFNKHVDEK